MQEASPSFLERVFEWSMDASTHIAIIVFLATGVFSGIWSIAVKPLLREFSLRYQRFLTRRTMATLQPALQELGLLEELGRARDSRRLRLGRTGRPEKVWKNRLLEIIREHSVVKQVMLGKQHSQPSEVFVDLRAAAMDVNKRAILADVLANLISSTLDKRLNSPDYRSIDRIVGMKEGNPLVTALVAEKLKMPISLYRGVDFPRFHDSKDPADFFDGEIHPGERVILVDDATFRGTTLIGAARKLTELNAQPLEAFLLFEPKLDTARRSLGNLDIPLRSVLTLRKRILRRK